MSKTVEYRVRAVTRYVVTRFSAENEKVSSEVIGEFENIELANHVGDSLARAHQFYNATFHGLHETLPGKVMRCKVVLHSRSQAYAEAERDAEGKPPGRFTENPWSYERRGETVSGVGYVADPTDPANIVLDGEHLRFSAVCPPTCDPNGAEENLIFGQYTPNFDLTAHVRNPSVLAALERGAAYYVDFTPAPGA
jgi:hypothetical protein